MVYAVPVWGLLWTRGCCGGLFPVCSNVAGESWGSVRWGRRQGKVE